MYKYSDLTDRYKTVINSWNSQGNFNIPTNNNSNLEYVYENHKRIFKHILTFIQPNNTPYVLSTKIGYIILLALILRETGHIDESNTYEKIYKKMKKDMLKQEMTQEMTPKQKQNWVSHQELFTKIKRLKITSDNTLTKHYEYLMLALVYYQPPLRADYHDMKKIVSLKDISSDALNYILKTKKGYEYIIQNDKVSKSWDTSYIQILDKKLVTILDNSFITFPRSYLFTQIRDTNIPMNTREYNKRLKGLINGKCLSMSILRASYISWFYKNNVSIMSREKLAKQMRHSRQRAELTYNKLDVNDNGTSKKVKIMRKDNDDKFDVKEWSKKYQKENKDKFKEASKRHYHANKYEISRKKILKHLNTNTSAKPRKKTIQTYDIKFDNDAKLWL